MRQRSAFYYHKNEIGYSSEKEPFIKPTLKPRHFGVKVCSLVVGGANFLLLSYEDEPKVFQDEIVKFLKTNCSFSGEIVSLKSIDDLSQIAVLLSKQKVVGVKEADFLQRVDNHIEKNLAVEQFNGTDLAKQLCCCEMQLYRKLKKHTNLSPANYIRCFRLNKSTQLLIHSTYSVSEICFMVGFKSLEYYSRSFKKEYGVSPTIYRRRNIV